ncbi:MAG TPA: hypothetical protein VK721_09945 [Solirubrobacteraceae bacterium]|jgi:hypothetical protein|nr:hypothetical protein [Solirubrobacteraceae bacterium]
MWRQRTRSRATVIGSSPLQRILLTSGLAGAIALVLATSALAAGQPVNVGTPFESGQPAIAVDGAGDAVIAWANTKDLAGANNFVQYCVLPVGAVACAHSGNLTPGDSAQYIDGVQVIAEGSTFVILADVFGTTGGMAADYEPEQEWQSSDGGQTWSFVNDGLSVTSGIVNADTGPLSAVMLPGTGVLGYGWDTAAGAPTFNAFPLSSPPECSVTQCPAGHATLEPETNPDTLGNEPGHFASQSGAAAGVMGVFDSLFTNGPLGCSQSFGTAYVYGSGDQSSTNNYNVSPGQPNSAWRVPLTQADCNAEYSTVGGGPSGFGILEDDLGTSSVVYHRFDQATLKFDSAPVTVVSGHGELDPALSQDGTGGIYATYLGGAGGAVDLSYSGDGGNSFATAVLNANASGGINDVASSVNAVGQGWASWAENGSVFAESFQAADAISAATIGSGATSEGSTVTLNVTCASFPCTVTIVLTAPETVVVHAASAHHTKGKTLTLGKGTITIKTKGDKKLKFKLSSAAHKLLKGKKGHFKVSALVSTQIEHHTTKLTKTLTLSLR